MKTVTTTPELLHSTTESNSHLFDDWLDPIETGIRDRVRQLIEEMIRSGLDAVRSRPRYGRRAGLAEDSDRGCYRPSSSPATAAWLSWACDGSPLFTNCIFNAAALPS